MQSVSVTRSILGLSNLPCKGKGCISPLLKIHNNSPCYSDDIIMGHNLVSDGLGGKNFKYTSSILPG